MKLRCAVLTILLAAMPSGHAAATRTERYVDRRTGALEALATGNATEGAGAAKAAGSENSLPDAPGTGSEAVDFAGGVRRAPSTRMRLHTSPFSAIAVMFKVGLEGTGIDVATPLATKINLRASVSYSNLSPTISYDNVAVQGDIRLRTASVSVDLFPYRGTFHISPGITLFNQNHATVIADIPGGETFTINDTDYTSDPADPIRAHFDFHMGRRVGPNFTVGWGNMLRANTHWSIPVDFGFEYVGTPKFGMYVTGSACDPSEGCFSVVTDAATQQNLAQEQTQINQDIAPLRFFPLLSVGVSYRFGASRDRSNWQ